MTGAYFTFYGDDMALYTIADLHLSLTANKPMNIFGGWDDYVERLEMNWNSTVADNDTVVVPGDISWAMNFDEALADFDFINKLKGKKILIKGNHDYWWTSFSKMNNFLTENGFTTIKILHNNHYAYNKYGICGSRGWINETSNPADAKILAREAMRLEASIKSAVNAGLIPIVFLHYPPIYGNEYNYDILDVLYKYKIEKCYYGHIHGYGHKNALCGIRDDIDFQLISSDFVQFKPKFVL